MKKIGIIIFASALVIGLVVSDIFSFGHAAHGLFKFSIDLGGEKGSGKIVTEKRSLSGFKGVDVGGVFQVEITAGKEFAVEVETDDNLLPLIKTEVNNGVLEIESTAAFHRQVRSWFAFPLLISVRWMFPVRPMSL